MNKDCSGREGIQMSDSASVSLFGGNIQLSPPEKNIFEKVWNWIRRIF